MLQKKALFVQNATTNCDPPSAELQLPAGALSTRTFFDVKTSRRLANASHLLLFLPHKEEDENVAAVLLPWSLVLEMSTAIGVLMLTRGRPKRASGSCLC